MLVTITYRIHAATGRYLKKLNSNAVAAPFSLGQYRLYPPTTTTTTTTHVNLELELELEAQVAFDALPNVLTQKQHCSAC